MFNPMFNPGMMSPSPWMYGGPGFGYPYTPFGPWMGYGPGPMGYGFGPGTFGVGFPGYGPGYGPGFYTESWPSDDQIRDMIYDSIDADPVVPFDTDVNVEVTGGVVTLTGTVPSKRIKHAIGDDAWWVPGVWDVNNNIQIAPRRKVREAEGAPQPAAAPKRTSRKTPTK